MHIVHHAHLRCDRRGGTRQLVAADHHQGIGQFQVWVVTLDPGAATGKVALPEQNVAAMLETELGSGGDAAARASLSDLAQSKPKAPEAAPAAAAAKPKPTGSAKYVVIALVVLLCAAAAWFGTR